MEDQVGYPLADRQAIIGKIFGNEGLTESIDVDTFTRLDRLNKFICKKDEHVGQKKFLPYVQNKLVPLLKAHVTEPVKAGKCKPNWTNNNCKSANHILMSATQWKLKIINILYVIISGEKTELCLGIRDMGNFKLTQPFFSLYIEYRCMCKPYPGTKGEKKK